MGSNRRERRFCRLQRILVEYVCHELLCGTEQLGGRSQLPGIGQLPAHWNHPSGANSATGTEVDFLAQVTLPWLARVPAEYRWRCFLCPKLRVGVLFRIQSHAN